MKHFILKRRKKPLESRQEARTTGNEQGPCFSSSQQIHKMGGGHHHFVDEKPGPRNYIALTNYQGQRLSQLHPASKPTPLSQFENKF